MPINVDRARQYLKHCDLRALFLDALGWDKHQATLNVTTNNQTYVLTAIAHKRGMVAYQCPTTTSAGVPDYADRRTIEHQVAKSAHEHLIVFTDAAKTTQIWQWVKREPGKPTACREHTFHASQPGDALLQKLDAIAFSLDEEDTISLPTVTGRARAAFDVERVTKRFYEQFQKEHTAFLKFITGIAESDDREWYASVMLNRLMFVYFMQRKGFLDDDREYLRNRLVRCRNEKGHNKFYSFYRYFLLRLFREGLGGRKREPGLEKLIGRVPYLNGGIFDIHELERPERYGKIIEIPDRAFERIFDYFDQYQWHLDERPLRADNEINPDVLGYIFEKYINQKQMGAYYTKEDITGYISNNTLLPSLFDAARSKCKIAFENPTGPTVWDLLKDDPDRYIHAAMRHGTHMPLPPEIAVGLDPAKPDLMEHRKSWNRPAPHDYGLPTEIWREVVTRRQRYEETKAKLAAGEVRDINDLVTLNLDTRQFAQDVIENSVGPDLLRSFWHAIDKVTILDPTCGSGAFLFAALNILEPLYEACLDRMVAFVEDQDRSTQKQRADKFSDFRKVLAHVAAHPNRRYFIFKSIILNNLFGVDILEEAVEICKLRLFLKLAAQVEPDAASANVGIEPLPDIDFNIRAGNTLVGYANYAEVKKAITSKLDLENAMKKIAIKAADLQQTFDTFRQRQTEGDGSVPAEQKIVLRQRLESLEDELNRHLAGEYRVKASDKASYAKWLKSHQPFHWFVEFYGIMSSGGFDVVIGNPPYVEYKKIKSSSYSVHPEHFLTEGCGNLLAFVTEQALSLLNQSGRLGLVLLVSTFTTERMSPLQDLVIAKCNSLWISNFAWRPSKLFDGCNTINAIILGSKRQDNGPRRVFSTKYIKWGAQERDFLFALLSYGDSTKFVIHGSIPKVASTLDAQLLTKIRSQKTSLHELFSGTRDSNKLFYFRGMLYWIKVLDHLPLHKEDGKNKISSQCKRVLVRSDVPAHCLIAVISSSLFFWFYQTYSDCQQINQREFVGFQFDPGADIHLLATLGKKLMLDYKENSKVVVRHIHRRGATVKKEYFEINKSKPILDGIDEVLAQHYDFTNEEMDFIINCDVKYRMGRDIEDEDEE